MGQVPPVQVFRRTLNAYRVLHPGLMSQIREFLAAGTFMQRKRPPVALFQSAISQSQDPIGSGARTSGEQGPRHPFPYLPVCSQRLGKPPNLPEGLDAESFVNRCHRTAGKVIAESHRGGVGNCQAGSLQLQSRPQRSIPVAHAKVSQHPAKLLHTAYVHLAGKGSGRPNDRSGLFLKGHPHTGRPVRIFLVEPVESVGTRERSEKAGQNFDDLVPVGVKFGLTNYNGSRSANLTGHPCSLFSAGHVHSSASKSLRDIKAGSESGSQQPPAWMSTLVPSCRFQTNKAPAIRGSRGALVRHPSPSHPLSRKLEATTGFYRNDLIISYL